MHPYSRARQDTHKARVKRTCRGRVGRYSLDPSARRPPTSIAGRNCPHLLRSNLRGSLLFSFGRSFSVLGLERGLRRRRLLLVLLVLRLRVAVGPEHVLDQSTRHRCGARARRRRWWGMARAGTDGAEADEAKVQCGILYGTNVTVYNSRNAISAWRVSVPSLFLFFIRNSALAESRARTTSWGPGRGRARRIHPTEAPRARATSRPIKVHCQRRC